jgi:hypothetical protein
MKVNKYYPFAFIYFFVNALGLPFGLLYTTLFTPFFYVWMVLKGKRLIVFRFFIAVLPFIINHLINGVDLQVYLSSLILFLTVYIFGYAFYTLLTKGTDMEGIFKKISAANLLLTLAAILLLSTSYRHIFWYDWTFSYGGVSFDAIPRLKMFTYEPSYYATLLVPLFAFFFAKYLLKQYQHSTGIFQLLIVLFPLILSFSFGVISGLCLAVGLLFLANMELVLTKKKLFYSFLVISVSALLCIAILFIFYRDNPFFIRLIAFVSGADQSGRGRTTEAFELAYTVAKEKSIWWGIGPGQLKIIGDPIIRSFYGYPANYGQVSIPNAVGETMALFGFVGVFLRLSIQIYLFFKTRVLNNYFRTLLFFYIFVYQFTGSFTTNVAEYVIWILAFTNPFPEFDKKPKTKSAFQQDTDNKDMYGSDKVFT